MISVMQCFASVRLDAVAPRSPLSRCAAHSHCMCRMTMCPVFLLEFSFKNVGSAPKCTLSQVDSEEGRPLLECPANIGYHVIQMCKFQCMRCHVAGQTKLIHMCGISGDSPGVVASPTVGWLQHCPRTRPSLLGRCVPMFPLGRLILFIVSASILTGIGFEGLACVRDFMSCSEVIMAVFGAWQDGWKCVARGHE